jgi:hypothetical protein
MEFNQTLNFTLWMSPPSSVYKMAGSLPTRSLFATKRTAASFVSAVIKHLAQC